MQKEERWRVVAERGICNIFIKKTFWVFALIETKIENEQILWC